MHTSTRQRVWRAAVVPLTLALLAVAGCAGGTGPGGTSTAAAPATTAPASAATTPLVMIIRHGEKPVGVDLGFDAQGNEDPSSLTKVGWDRANALVGLFDPQPGPPRAGLATPVAIYAAGANDDGEGTRTRETVTPLANRLGLTVNSTFGKGQEKDLVDHVLGQPGPTLLSWQHEEIPAIADEFPNVSPKPPKDWPDDRFDVVWIFTRTGDSWQFSQQPELVLPQDSSSVIKD